MTTTNGTAQVTLPADDQILISREFAAPRALVWRAITEPALVRRWWAGLRGQVDSAEIDLRVGGRWRYVMTANGGFEVAFHGEYREISEPERLVSTEAYEGVPDPDGNASLNTVTLVEKDGRTFMEVLCVHKSKENRDMVIASGMEGGMQESYDALEQVAASLA
ncbi:MULTISPECIES: SRPBCC family protein [Actinoplanes]|uniref:ATPase n=2 Tax=Actinoplanes TaxID=1865 RepID=A0A0X3V646_9ACTN|nr:MULTISPECIES: SRPBCC family protein [Actinoplanes]KUL39917.1 ATPase [Actinoplanes awajinensis subsp. mycoplanecinus]GIE65196.1 hypothetical protein Apa02nite_013040 [Actinoplanes palleronii]